MGSYFRRVPFDARDMQVRQGNELVDARRMRDAIAIALALLDELHELIPNEPDGTALREIADLFEEISGFAKIGARAARKAAGGDR